MAWGESKATPITHTKWGQVLNDNKIVNYVYFPSAHLLVNLLLESLSFLLSPSPHIHHFPTLLLLPPRSSSPAWSACGRTCTPCHPRAWTASWRRWWSGRRTSLTRPTPATSSGRPSWACASWRAKTPSSWCTPGSRRYVGTGGKHLHRCTHTHLQEYSLKTYASTSPVRCLVKAKFDNKQERAIRAKQMRCGLGWAHRRSILHRQTHTN